MSSSTTEDLLKSGHRPAKIAGGMRISQKEKRTSENDNSEPSNESASANSNELMDYRQTNNILASTGLAGKTIKEFPEEAIRAFHEKPHPRHEPSVYAHDHRQSGHIFQPRKN